MGFWIIITVQLALSALTLVVVAIVSTWARAADRNSREMRGMLQTLAELAQRRPSSPTPTPAPALARERLDSSGPLPDTLDQIRPGASTDAPEEGGKVIGVIGSVEFEKETLARIDAIAGRTQREKTIAWLVEHGVEVTNHYGLGAVVAHLQTKVPDEAEDDETVGIDQRPSPDSEPPKRA
jgi:hypothetical protein